MISRHDPLEEQQTRRLSTNGHLIGWAIFGGLLVIGFFFGVVTGYEKPPTNSQPPKGQPLSSSDGASLKSIPATEVKPTIQPKDELPLNSAPPKIDSSVIEFPKSNPAIAKKPKEAPAPKKEMSKSQATVPVSFQKDVLPILRTHCLNCHGAGTGKPKGDVNLTSIANMMRSRGGKILVPGKPNDSDIYTSITEREMPDGGRPKPTEKELTVLRNWILTGATPRRRLRASSGQSRG